MSRKESDFHKRLLATFQVEAEERVSSLASGLIELEKTAEASQQAEIVELIFREVHSLKGAARSVNLMEFEAICQAMEDVFAALKRNKITPSVNLLDHLHQATDLLKGLLSASHAQQEGADRTRHAPLIRQLKELARQNIPPAPASERAMPAAPVTPPSPAASPDPLPDPAPDLSPATVPSAPPATPVEHPEPSEAAKRKVAAPYDSEWHVESMAQIGQRAGTEETVRIAAARLESLLLQVEELVSVKLAVSQRAAELREPTTQLALWDKQWTKFYPALRTLSSVLESLGKQEESQNNAQNGSQNYSPNQSQNGQRADASGARASELHKIKTQLASLLEFLEWNQNWVESLHTQLAAISNAANHDQRTIGSMVDHLLQDMKQVLMLPLSSILETFPSLARDLARQQGKEAQIVFQGAEIEVDRRILQEIKDPLIHLVRNCIDHGIETPAVREQQQKPRRGTVTITILQRDSSKFEILLSDDGAGIDLLKVRNAATRLGFVSAEAVEKLSQQETESLIFQSGFSTSPLITDISGRGLGLAIVQEKVEKLGGTITLETAPGQGTTFHLVLPLTLATLRGLLIRCQRHPFILPILYIERVARINLDEVQTVQNRDTIRFDGQTLSLVRLAQPLELPIQKSPQEAPNNSTGKNRDKILVVVLNTAEKRIAFRVDEIIGEQEVLMKGLGPQLARVRNIAGATVLGTGEVIPILNVPDLIKSAIRTIDQAAQLVEQSPIQDKHILVVEDSITARMQLKSILELSGYTVKTAVDGLEALTTLRTESFDLVVSDVDMPRLNGLDLTARIRGDKTLADLPVVLVTALASRQDQERGIEVGANAYITKSNFDQNKLLDAIRRLI